MKITDFIKLKVNLNLCLCGCDQVTNFRNGKYNKYIKKHFTKAHWKGGRVKYGKYWAIRKPNHPFATNRGYVPEHRLVYEEHYNCILLPYNIAHIISTVIQKIIQSKLVPCYNGQHRKKYHKLDTSNRLCLFCKTNKTFYDKNRKYVVWRKYKDGYMCNICYCKYVRGR